MKKLKRAISKIEMCLKDYNEENEKSEIKVETSNNKFFSNFNKEEYEKSISSLKDYIRNGDVYIANMTRRIWCNNNEDPLKYMKN